MTSLRIYQLTSTQKKRIVAVLEQNPTKFARTIDGELLCRRCGQPILVGQTVISKATNLIRKYYHLEPCARILKIR